MIFTGADIFSWFWDMEKGIVHLKHKRCCVGEYIPEGDGCSGASFDDERTLQER